MARISLSKLLEDADGMVCFLGAEILRKTGRTEGPLDGRCEVCDRPADSFTLADWLAWHCSPCFIGAARAFGGDSRLIIPGYSGAAKYADTLAAVRAATA